LILNPARCHSSFGQVLALAIDHLIGLAYNGKDIVFRFIIEYIVASKDFGP
jgi:hypothetical protein